jgi:hypothetical protein
MAEQKKNEKRLWELLWVDCFKNRVIMGSTHNYVEAQSSRKPLNLSNTEQS